MKLSPHERGLVINYNQAACIIGPLSSHHTGPGLFRVGPLCLPYKLSLVIAVSGLHMMSP